jgi:hypothetical protein
MINSAFNVVFNYPDNFAKKLNFKEIQFIQVLKKKNHRVIYYYFLIFFNIGTTVIYMGRTKGGEKCKLSHFICYTIVTFPRESLHDSNLSHFICYTNIYGYESL